MHILKMAGQAQQPMHLQAKGVGDTANKEAEGVAGGSGGRQLAARCGEHVGVLLVHAADIDACLCAGQRPQAACALCLC